MTERAAADAIVDAVAGIAESSLEQGGEFGRRFTHCKTIGRGSLRGSSREFNLICDGGAKLTKRSGEMTQSYVLLVDYPAHFDEYEIDRIIHRDADRLTQRLSQPNNWGSESTICIVEPDGALICPYEVDVFEEDGVLVGLRLVMTFSVTHTGQNIP